MLPPIPCVKAEPVLSVLCFSYIYLCVFEVSKVKAGRNNRAINTNDHTHTHTHATNNDTLNLQLACGFIYEVLDEFVSVCLVYGSRLVDVESEGTRDPRRRDLQPFIALVLCDLVLGG